MWEQDGGVLSRSKERRVFLFEQIIIFSELLRKGSNNPGYQFKNSIKVKLGGTAEEKTLTLKFGSPTFSAGDRFQTRTSKNANIGCKRNPRRAKRN